MINKPGEVWVEKAGDLRMESLPEIDIDHLLGLGRLIAQSTDQSGNLRRKATIICYPDKWLSCSNRFSSNC